MEKNLYKKLEKIVVNTGIGRLATSSADFTNKVLPEVEKEFAVITGQKAQQRTAKQSISGFKIREGMVIGLKATLRGKMMEKFLDKLVKTVLPRLRDFRGISFKNIDQGGNLTIGIKEQVVFPEIIAESSRVNFGIQAIIVPKEITREEAVELYKNLGIPFRKDNK